MPTVKFRLAREPRDLEQVHALHYKAFVEEIPQHAPNENARHIDRFHDENDYIVALDGERVIGSLAVRRKRPFSLDSKLENLDEFLLTGYRRTRSDYGLPGAIEYVPSLKARGLNHATFLAGVGPHLSRQLASWQPDVVVSTYPGCTLTLAPLRRRGYMKVPLVSAVTDLAQLRYWAWPGVDLHLITHPESEGEVRAIAGQDARVVCVRGLTSPGFTDPPDAAAGQREFSLPPSGPVAVVSGGGWAVGDLASAVEVCLAERSDLHVVVLCGRNEGVLAALSDRYGTNSRVHVSGFTEHMNELFAAADVLIHSTAGLTVLEAYMRGCRVISYGWGIAHIKANNRAFERYGIARVAATRADLAAALHEAVEHPRADRSEWFAALPSAASAVLEVAGEAA